MKCYNHPIEDAVGACSICGRGLCTKCAKIVDNKIICEKCYMFSQAIEPSKLKKYALISAVLGWLGAVNVTLIGVYVTLKLFYFGIMRGYQTEAYIVGILTAGLTLTLIFGGYWMWRGRLREGGILNVIVGIVTLTMYSYFNFSVPLLREFGIAGSFLCVPALISGVLGLISGTFFKKKMPLRVGHS